jgi:mannose-6-phosphate isomerase-like protein (cupin superfamily)
VIDGLKMEWLHITLPPKTYFDYPFLCGPNTTKFLLVKKGSINVTIQDKLYKLAKDESLYFTSNLPHKIENTTSQPVEYYVVVGHGG